MNKWKGYLTLGCIAAGGSLLIDALTGEVVPQINLMVLAMGCFILADKYSSAKEVRK